MLLSKFKKGKDVTFDDGTLLENKRLTFDPPTPQQYAFCSDTVYDESIIQYIQNVDFYITKVLF